MISISAYTTTRNAVEMDYPFEESIRSMLQFADEVVVLDSGSGFGRSNPTGKRLLELAEQDSRISVVLTSIFDWSAPNHGIFDGQTKALARSYCKGDFLWQFDTDEIVHELDAPKVRPLIEKLNYLQQCPIMALPVVEYWGSQGKVRADINPWKARLSRNLPDITHGIPVHLRRTFNGLDYASPGTDTCVVPGTKVVTDRGELPIEAIKIGDLVLTHAGTFEKVTRCYERTVTNHPIYKLQNREIVNGTLEITDNHPILFGSKKNLDDAPRFISLGDCDIKQNLSFVFPRLTSVNQVSLGKTLGFLIGLYLGDGSITMRTENKNTYKNVRFTLSEYQTDVISQIIKATKKHFNVTPRVYRDKKKHCINVVVNGEHLAEWLFNICGKGCETKELSIDAYNWDTETIMGVLEGLYQSDGADCRSGINIVMKNGKLLSQIRTLLTKADIFASLRSYKQKPSKFNPTETEMFQLRITGLQAANLTFVPKPSTPRKQRFKNSKHGFLTANLKVPSVRLYSGKLYNLEVDKHNSYVANGITVHNCDYISKSTGKILPVMGFMTPEIESLRQMCLKNPKLIHSYQKWFNNAVNELPGVFHYSWFSVERKIKQYREFWTSFWKAMYGPDSAQNKDPNWNPFFEVPWSQVTDQMIKEKAHELETHTGGHIFHSRWTGVQTPHVIINRNHPQVIQEWVKNHAV
jgi:hypothetical protein